MPIRSLTMYDNILFSASPVVVACGGLGAWMATDVRDGDALRVGVQGGCRRCLGLLWECCCWVAAPTFERGGLPHFFL